MQAVHYGRNPACLLNVGLSVSASSLGYHPRSASAGNFVTLLHKARRTFIIIIIMIKNVLIRVTLHTKVLQGHFTQLMQKHCRSCETKATD